MENKIDKAKEAFAEKLQFPKDVVLDLPKVVIIGNSEIEIENQMGIVHFDENEIRIQTKIGEISIQGSSFEINFMGGSTVDITGKIKNIIYE